MKVKFSCKNITRIILFLLTTIMLYSILAGSRIDIAWLQSNIDRLQYYTLNHPFISILGFLFLRYLFAVISVPGSGVLSIAGGAIFDFRLALLLVLFSTNLGTMTVFLLSRYALGDLARDKFSYYYGLLKKPLREYCLMLLFLLRISEIFPSLVINSLFALTPIKTFTYFWVSFLGQLPGIFIFVNAGSHISEIERMGDLMSPRILLSLTALGLLPLLSKFVYHKIPVSRELK